MTGLTVKNQVYSHQERHILTKKEFSDIVFNLKIENAQRLIEESYDEFMDQLPNDLNKKFIYYIENSRRLSPMYVKTLTKSFLMECDRCLYCLSPLWIEDNKSDDPYLCKSCYNKRNEYYESVPKQEKKKINPDEPLLKTLKKIRERLALNEAPF